MPLPVIRHFVHTPVQGRSNDKKVSLRTVSVWYQRCNSSRVSQFQDTCVSWTAKACFFVRLRSKTYRFGHTPVEGRSDGTRGEPQNSSCAAPEGQQETSETRIQSKAVPTLHTLGKGKRALFPVLYYPCRNVMQTPQDARKI